MANKNEIDNALKIFNSFKTSYALLHCISSYPTESQDANLNVIRTMKKNYNCPIGYSDHTLGTTVPILSVAVGACIIEKHFTLDKKLDGPDHQLSANPDELNEIVTKIREVEKILGTNKIQLYDTEKPTLIYRRKS
jgi:sialic acid synthase SpsE